MNPPTCRFCKKAEYGHRCGTGALVPKVRAATRANGKTKPKKKRN